MKTATNEAITRTINSMEWGIKIGYFAMGILVATFIFWIVGGRF